MRFEVYSEKRILSAWCCPPILFLPIVACSTRSPMLRACRTCGFTAPWPDMKRLQPLTC